MIEQAESKPAKSRSGLNDAKILESDVKGKALSVQTKFVKATIFSTAKFHVINRQ